MLPVDEALKRVLAPLGVLPGEIVPLGAGLGRVLAADLPATRDQPPRDLSAMDGYAVRAADLASGGAWLDVVGEAPAGGSHDRPLQPGQAVRIFTGGPLPEGADAVAIQENAEVHGSRVRLTGAVGPGTYVRPRGLDFRAGEVGLPAGHALTARDLGFAAALNHAWLPVRRRPRLALLATGDELVPPGSPLGPNRIVSSNSTALAAMIAAWGGEAVNLGIAGDRPAELAEAVRGAAGCDMLVTTGGASVGDHDLVRGVLGRHGLELDFWQIAMRPGKPLLFGSLGGVPLLGLPGNPVSVGVCALLFVRAAVRAMLGLDPALPETTGVLGVELGPNDRRQEYLRSASTRRPDGTLEVRPFKRQDSSMLALFARADCLVVREPFAPAMGPGTTVRVVPLGDSLVRV